MTVVHRLDWEAVAGAVSYKITELNVDGTETQKAVGVTDTHYDITHDNAVDHAYLIYPYDGTNYSAPIQIIVPKPVTLVSLRDQVRIELRDTATDIQRYSDDELAQYIRDAIRDYAKHFPDEKKTTITLSKDVRVYRLPSDLVSVNSVAYTDVNGNQLYLKNKPWRDGEAVFSGKGGYWKLGISPLRTSSRPWAGYYLVRDGQIEIDFDPDANEKLIVHYGGMYPDPVFDTVRIDVPVEDHELLVLYACGKATVRIENQDANLSRWDQDGRRDDNPLIPVANRYFNAYNQKIKERKSRPRAFRRSRV